MHLLVNKLCEESKVFEFYGYVIQGRNYTNGQTVLRRRAEMDRELCQWSDGWVGLENGD
jgi:hypothetical protein